MPNSLKQPKEQELLDFMLLYAKLYLASGGPTSRLEDSLVKVGAKYGKHAEVFATPTGIFVTTQDIAHQSDPRTALMRLKETGTNLAQLSMLEQVYTDVIDGRLTIHAGLETLKNPIITRSVYSSWQTALAAFFTGFVICFDAYQRLDNAFISGLITVLVWAFTTHILKRAIGNPIFTDFAGAFLTLVLAAVAHGLIAPASIEAYAVGGIVLLVPGLALTTAIAELADQNLVSGTARFMQAVLALLALGLAYLLFQQMAFSLGIRTALLPTVAKAKIIWISGLALLVNVTCFGVILKTPKKSLLFCTITGLGGWMVLQFFQQGVAAAAAPFLGSLAVGLLSLSFGKIFRQPSQLYSVPGIVAMLPGMLALSGFRYFASGDQETGIEFTFKVAVTAVSIVFGLMSARIPFIIGGRYRQFLR
jgi:uncharacterized membrane protein YjjP (DUF1212 family)